MLTKTDIYMKLSVLFIVLSIFILTTFCTMAQSPQTGYFTDGYLYRHTMNPAIANTNNYVSLPVLGNNNISFRGNLALSDVLYQVEGKTATFLHPNLSSQEVLENIKEQNKIGLNANFQLFSMGFNALSGYNTIGINVRSNINITLPGQLFRLAKEGVANETYNISNFYSHANAYMEFALGHSHQINDKLHIGATLKYLIGAGNVDAQFNKAELALGQNEWIITSDAQVETSIKNFIYKTKTNDKTNNQYVSGADIDKLGINGGGVAIDLGVDYQLNDDWNLSASIIDLGFINWKNNMLATTNGEKTFTTNEYIFNVDDDEANNFDDELDRMGNGLTSLYELDDNGDQGSISKSIGTTFNIGASYTLRQYQKLSIGLLGTSHIQENFNWTDVRASFNWTPYNFLSASVSAAYGTFGGTVGWMLNLQPKGFNLYLAMDQITGKLSKQYVPLSGAGTFHVGLNIPF